MKSLSKTLSVIALTMLMAFNAAQAQVPTDSIVADFNEFVRLLEETHPDPYTNYGGRPYFRMAASDTRNTLLKDKVTDIREFAYRINEFLAPLKDGHTVAMPDGHNVPGHFPIKYTDPATLIMLEAINDGILVKALPDEYKDLIGCRLIAIENVPVKDVWSGMAKYFIAENEIGQMMNLAHYAMQPKALKKVIPNVSNSAINYQLQTPKGKKVDLSLPVVPYKQVQQWQYAMTQKPSAFPAKEFSYNFMDLLMYSFVDKDNDIMYFHPKHMIARDCLDYELEHGADVSGTLQGIYGAVGMPVPPDQNIAIAMIPSLSEEFNKALQQMKQHGSKNLIIDMRGNGGGTTHICRPLVYMLYGDEYLKVKDNLDQGEGIVMITPNNTSKSYLDYMNSVNTYKFEYGDYYQSSLHEPLAEITEEMRNNFINNSMCSVKDVLRAQHGQPVYKPEHVYVVTDPLTYSAAFHITYFLSNMGATVVGVSSSQAPNTFMGQENFTLPRTGLEGEIDLTIQKCYPDDHPRAKQFYPDIMPKYEDYKRYNFDDNASVLYLLDIINGKIKRK